MFALRYWVRQSRRVSFKLLLLALVLSVAAISSVGVFSARLEAALVRDARHMLGGDLVVESKRNLDLTSWKSWLQPPPNSGISAATSVVFPSVVPSEQTDLLVSLKAVSSSYPLRGQLLTRNAQGQEESLASGPKPGEAWVDEGVLASLGVQLGDSIPVGQTRLTLARVILIEPDRGAGFVNFAPRLMMSDQDLPAANLLGPGSRATWRAYFAGSAANIEQLQTQLKPQLSTVETLETVEGGRPEVGGTLNRARDFMAMSALIGTLVACVGIALVSHVFAKEQSHELAVLKSLGFTPRALMRLCLSGLLGLTLLGGLLGVGLGWVAHWGLMALLVELVGARLPMAGLEYLPGGVALAGLLLLGFAAAPVWNALQAPAIAVLREQNRGQNRTLLVLSVVFGLLTGLAVCLLIISNTMLALTLFAGFVGVSVVFSALFWLLLQSLAKLEKARALSQRRARIGVFQSMAKRSQTLVVQGVSLSLGLSALLILAVVQGDLIDRWQSVVPSDAPNRFVFNIQPDQVDALHTQLQGTLNSPPELYPMVRGRLTHIGSQLLNAQSFANPDAQRMVEREFNLSFTNTLPKGNVLSKGQWFPSNVSGPQVSIETSVAKRLNLKLGDQLTFDIAGSPIQAQVTSIRDLRWDSMNVNFYIIFRPQDLADFPQTWITAFHAPESVANTLSRDLVRQYPNLTVLDTGLVISQIRKILSQVSQAVQFVFLFTVAAGGLVVAACVLTGSRARMRESAIYRALGASSVQLTKAAWTELAALGALAGLVSAIAAQALGWAVAKFIFEFDYMLSLSGLLSGVLAGVLVSVVFGAWNVRQVCHAPVMRTLRALQ